MAIKLLITKHESIFFKKDAKALEKIPGAEPKLIGDPNPLKPHHFPPITKLTLEEDVPIHLWVENDENNKGKLEMKIHSCPNKFPELIITKDADQKTWQLTTPKLPPGQQRYYGDPTVNVTIGEDP